MILSVRLLYRRIINAGNTGAHQAGFIEFPVLIAVGAEPISRVIMPLIGEAYCNACIMKGPQLFDEAVIEFLCSFAPEKLHYRCPS